MNSYILEKEMASAAERAAAPAAAAAAAPQSSWKSPVPYLFSALAAMLGLIAFALLVLGFSYWKLHGRTRHDGHADGGDVEADGGEKAPAPAPVVEEKFLVIMAGQERPTFLATPASSRASSFPSITSFRRGTSQTSLPLEKNIEAPQSALVHQFR